mmetsp:Transcript_9504/g.17664  ORF Transcript_9504/g.17664 Transcript_9504/m.17664 type:complete len:319 (+) Transcript_9504:107-1063(+)
MNYQSPMYEPAAGYGTGLLPDVNVAFKKARKASRSPFARSSQSNLNLGAICAALILPCLLYAFTFWTMSFSLHFRSTMICYCLVFCGLLLVVVMAKLAGDYHRQQTGHSSQNWFAFLTITCFIAWAAGVVCGDFNFFYNMEPFYSVAHLNMYTKVDPSKVKGGQFMDAGKLEFIKAAHLDRNKSMGFRSKDLYCVAPIVSGKKPLKSYDFWAIGLNCCNSDGADFRCGEFNNKHAHFGLRLMHDEQRGFFRLAVQQAESAHNIQSIHPLFFHWMSDPVSEVNAYMDEGYHNFIMGIFTFFVCQLLCVIGAVVFFAKTA